MQTIFHKNPNRQWITNGHSCMVPVHTKPEYQMMTPDTGHTQASVQITSKTPFSFWCHNNFSVQIQWYNDTAYNTTSAFAFVLQFVQRRSSASSAVIAAAMSFHHSASCSYSLLVSSMTLSCVPIDHSVRIWSCYAGDSPLLYVHPFHRGCNWTWTMLQLESLRRRCCHSCPNLPFQRF